MISKNDLELLLKKHLEDYSDSHTYILIAIFLLTIAFQIWQAIYVSNKIERFKNDLKKSEIKFSRFNTLQIDALKLIYDKTVTFHYMNYRLFYPKTYSHSSLKTKIQNWQSEFLSLLDTLHRERILLPTGVEKIVQEIDKSFKKISEYLENERKDIISVEDYDGTDDPQILYQNSENEIESIKKRVEKLNLHPEIINSEALINKFRREIESYFSSLNK